MLDICRWFFLGISTVITLIPRYLYLGIKCLIDPKESRILEYKGKPIIPVAMISLSADILESTKILEKEKKEVINTEEFVSTDEDKYANISFLSVDFTELLRKNSDTVAWLKVNNTNVNYAVVQGEDNEYYLNHDFNQNSNFGGWIYGDFRDII